MKNKDIQKKVELLRKAYDWEGLARAFAEGDVRWHAKEWREFIERIREEERARIRKMIKLTGSSDYYYKKALADLLERLE